MAVGELEGCGDGAALGTLVGAFVSGDDIVGANVGMVHRLALVGMAVGLTVGGASGKADGPRDGKGTGIVIGKPEGFGHGAAVGTYVGQPDGLALVGCAVGSPG